MLATWRADRREAEPPGEAPPKPNHEPVMIPMSDGAAIGRMMRRMKDRKGRRNAAGELLTPAAD